MSSSSYPPNSGKMKKIIIGVCAMERKAYSKPMKAIMSRMCDYYKEWLEFLIFPEKVILEEPVENWPLCDCLISFHSTDFPLRKAIEYERLRHPYTLNDLNRQFDLLDRRKVFRTLARAGIDHPRHCVLVRDEEGNLVGNDLNENNDHIEVNGMIFNKPFVEKPISAEDHNVYIYFPSSVGGGSQRLFRKVNDRSSWYSPVSTVRPAGSYIYEEFIPADGTDVKVYAVGPYYAHAEARKAPGLDGKVERDSDGKEIRYPVILSAREKMIARRVVLAFGQTVCGFDLLRANGRSFVCDVNGFSFVKTSTKYYEDTAKILGNMILRRLASCLSIPWHIPFQADDPPLVSTPSGKIMELRCVIAVIRHGDRTPKQKMKVIVSDERFFALFKKYDGTRRKEIKMKRPNQLMEVLDLIRAILAEQQALREEFMQKSADLMSKSGEDGDAELRTLERELEKCEESVKTWDQMRTVLEMYGHFSGINRKVQLKYFKPKEPKSSKSQPSLDQQQSLGGSTSSVLGASSASAPNVATDEKPKLMLILKWGGELTTAGVLQAEALGKLFRTLYPGIRRTDGRDCPEDTQGLGFLRLHSTYRHDLKIYASDEGRVQMTAAAFAKGLLALEGELTPILMQMVKSANTDGLLNDDYSARQFQNELKSYLHSALQVDRDFTLEDYQSLNPSGLRSLNNAMEFIKNPRKMCHEIAGYVERMCDIIRWHKHQNFSTDKNRTLYLNETWELAERRWSKELREFRKVNKSGDGTVDFDISKIPDIYDNIKYDMEHNPDLCINNEGEFERFYLCVKNMADIVVPQEYGISEESKICVAQRVCSPLMSKLRNDLHRCVQNPDEGEESLTRLDPRASEGIATPMRHVRTRLYFTSESHIHTLMNLIRYGGLCSPDDKKWQRAMNFLSGVTEFNYMTQVVLMVYEDSRNEADEKVATDRFHIELLFSPGLYPCFQTEKERIYESRFNSKKQQQQNTSQQQPHSKTSQSSENSKTKNLSGKSSSDTSDKELAEMDGAECSTKNSSKNQKSNNSLTCELSNSGTEAENPAEESKRSQREKRPSPVRHHHYNVLHTSKTDLSEKASANYENKMNRNANNNSSKTAHEEEDYEDEEDELADHSVNLVVLGEVSGCKQFTSGFISATGDLARHSPPPSLSPLRKRRPSFERSLLPGLVEGQKLASIGEFTPAGNKPIFRQGCDGVEECSTKASISGDVVDASVRLVIPHLAVSKHKSRGINTTITKSMSDVACHRKTTAVDATEKINIFELSLPKSELDDHQTTVGYGRGEWAKDIVANSKKMSTIDQTGERSEGESISSKSSTNGERISLASVFIRDEPTTETSATDESKSAEKSSKVKIGRTDSDNSEGLVLNVKKNSTARSPAENDHLAVRENDNPATASSSTIKDDESGNLAMSRRSRFPYRFKHHTVNLLSSGNGVENRLISTDVLMGKFADAAKRKPLNNSAVLSTAVIARSSSAPRLQTYKAGDVIPMAVSLGYGKLFGLYDHILEIRRFWPPLRSLETMHDNIAFKELDIFLERMMKNSTPLPSPPKTPVHRDMSSDARASLDNQMKDTIKRLARMHS